MKFKYKKYGRGVIRPVIPLKLTHGNRTITQEVLVDSGADVCLFDAEVGVSIGVPTERGEPCVFAGVNAAPQPAYLHNVTVILGGWQYKIRAAFVPNFAPIYGIVGQKGFFELFTVKFSYQKEEIEIRATGGQK